MEFPPPDGGPPCVRLSGWAIDPEQQPTRLGSPSRAEETRGPETWGGHSRNRRRSRRVSAIPPLAAVAG